MGKSISFLVTVLTVLIAFIAGAGWASTSNLIFGRLEPAFIGALVAASGAIFAACIAYTGVQRQIEMAQKTAEANAQQQAQLQESQRKHERQRAADELSG